MNKRAPLNGIRDLESRKPNAGNADILHRAKEMGMKTWHLEKLQRIMNTMSNIPNDTQTLVANNTRTRAAFATGKGEREADLSRMLRNERLNGPSDRDATTALSELIPFKGCYIYVRDMDERSKPIMVRDYPKPAHRESGEWPQFHSVTLGKCPFVEEPPNRADGKAREEERRARDRVQSREAPRTRATTVREGAEAESAKTSALKGPLEETKNKANIAAPPSVSMPTLAFCPPPPAATAMPGSPSKTLRDAATHPRPKLFGGEPAASGMQPSNITSAIRSQMISSTAAAPGAKTGTSKEVHGLKRKVLEKNSGPALVNIHTRQRSIDPACDGRAERNIPTVRQTRRQAQEALVHIDEESTQSEEDEDVWLAEDKRRKKQGLKKVLEAKDQKPGYCENCREKYDDFDDVSFFYYSRSSKYLMLLSSIFLAASIESSHLHPKIGRSSTTCYPTSVDGSRSQTRTVSDNVSRIPRSYHARITCTRSHSTSFPFSWRLSDPSLLPSQRLSLHHGAALPKGLLTLLSIPFCIHYGVHCICILASEPLCIYFDLHLQGACILACNPTSLGADGIGVDSKC